MVQVNLKCTRKLNSSLLFVGVNSIDMQKFDSLDIYEFEDFNLVYSIEYNFGKLA